jgi:hypothetical protein
MSASWPSSVHSLRVTSETIEFGLTWPLAAGWDPKWSRLSKPVASVEVRASLEATVPLRWDDNCKESLPEYFWPSLLRTRTAGRVWEPSTLQEARVLRETETQEVFGHEARGTRLGADLVMETARTATAALIAKLAGPVSVSGTSRKKQVGNQLDRTMESDFFQQHGGLLSAHPEELDSASIALADIVGQMCVADAGVLLHRRHLGLADASPPAVTPLSICQAPTANEALAELRAMPPMLRTILWRFVSTRYLPPAKRGKGRARLEPLPYDDAAIEARALQLLPVFAILTGAHGDWSDLSKLSPFR